jgi:CubicO group peptidase (beta-lactamase class C family)
MTVSEDPAAATVAATDTDARHINALADAARRTERLRAIVVLKHGVPVLAEAFRGPPVDVAVNVKSVSKSVVAALVGCAIERGVLAGVGVTLDEIAPELIPADADRRIASLTVQDFLTMRLGLERQSGRNYGRWAASDDWVRYALTRPFVTEPGGRMLYSTAGWHVLGAMLSSLTGESLLTLSRRWLGEPLDIEFASWTRDPKGRYLGGNEMSMSPLEMVRLGELYRLGGRLNGESVMAEDWVSQSFTPRTVSMWSNDAYGYGWFLRPLGGLSAAYARGYGGQLIHVIPEAGLVVAITSGTTRAARSGGYMDTLHNLVETYLIDLYGSEGA